MRAGNAEAAIKIMDHHLGGVEARALLDSGRDAGFDLGAVLSRYAGTLDRPGSTKVARIVKPKAKGKG